MSFELSQIVIHEVIKNAHETGSSYFCSKSLLPIDKKSKFLAEELNRSFRKDSIYYGEFDDSKGKALVFRDAFQKAKKSRFDDKVFMDFTVDSTKDLSTRIDAISAAKGGYLVYCHYESRNTEFVSVFLVRDTGRVNFNRNKNTGSIEVEATESVDTDKLAMACRVGIERFSNGDHGYLQFIKNRQVDISEYFLKWIAAAQAMSSKEFTDTFVDIIKELGIGFKEDGSQYSEEDDFLKAITDYIKSTPAKTINLKDIGERFYSDKERIVNHVEENEIAIDTEFRAHGTALNKLWKLGFKDHNIEVSFTRGDWRSKRVNIIQGKLVIDSRDLINQIAKEFLPPDAVKELYRSSIDTVKFKRKKVSINEPQSEDKHIESGKNGGLLTNGGTPND